MRLFSHLKKKPFKIELETVTEENKGRKAREWRYPHW